MGAIILLCVMGAFLLCRLFVSRAEIQDPEPRGDNPKIQMVRHAAVVTHEMRFGLHAYQQVIV